MTFSKTNNSLTVVVLDGGKNTVLTTTNTNPRWTEIVEALKNDNEELVVKLMSIKNVVETYTEANVEIKNGNVFFKGRQLHGLDVNRLVEFAKDGIPFLPMARFLERKAKNPSMRSINELYQFLEHRKMPLTPEGKVLGYKGVKSDFYSITGNKSTVLLSGVVDERGCILNTVGSVIEVERSSVCDDFNVGCSVGLHIGSLEYASSFSKTIVIVEFDPADVVSVPKDCEHQKLRVCKYKVVGQYTGPLPDTYSEKYKDLEDGEDVEENDEDSSYDEDEDECTCDECNCMNNNSTDEDYAVCPCMDEDVENEECDCEQCKTEKSTEKSDEEYYSDGYTDGLKDGKAHTARKHHITDIEENENLTEWECNYISGYNDGYRFGRYGKS